MGFQKHGDVEKHEVVNPDDNAKLNQIRKASNVRIDDLDRLNTDYDADTSKTSD